MREGLSSIFLLTLVGARNHEPASLGKLGLIRVVLDILSGGGFFVCLCSTFVHVVCQPGRQ